VRNLELYCRVFISVVVLGGCSSSPAPTFDGGAAWHYLVKQCGYGPRVPGTAAHDSTVHYIVSHLERRRANVRLQPFTIDDPYISRPMRLINIIGSYGVTEKNRVLIAAHYDSRPWADQESDRTLWSTPILGANDGASGVSVLLALADILARHPPKGLGIDLVFFDGEDYGKQSDTDNYLLGSKHFAANLAGYRPRCGILLDMVGAKDARIYQEGYSLQKAPRLTEALFGRAAELGLGVFVAKRGDFLYDDHVPLLMAGIPMVDLIGLPYPHWHTLRDTPENCSRDTLWQVGTLMVDFIYNFPF
jgi:hypothetical protein